MFHTLFYNIKFFGLIIASLVSLGIIITIHELGHFCFAKLFGVRTPSFSIGMGGPVIFSKQIGDTLFKINAIPLGGYLEIAGQAEIGQGDQKDAHATDAGSFAVKSYWQKLLIMSGGVLFNFLAAFLVFIGLFWAGMPKTIFFGGETVTPIVSTVAESGTAHDIKLQTDDIITTINDIPTPSVTSLIEQLKQNAGNPVTLTVKRADQVLTFNPTLEKTGLLGIAFKIDGTLPRESFLHATKQAFYAMGSLTKYLIHIFSTIFTKRAINNLGSPLMFISSFISSEGQGISFLLFLLAFFSLNLFILNLIPLPITDGGQLVILTIETIIRRPLPEKFIYWLHLITWGLILLLTAYLLIKDSIVLFWPKIKSIIGK